MAKLSIALLVLVAVYAAEASPSYNGCWNGYDYDCCRGRLPNFYYPSLSKPLPYYYRCIGMRVVYGRCGVNLCVTRFGTCGSCSDYCKYTQSVYYYSSYYFYGRYYYRCNRGITYYRTCGLNQSYYPGVGRCGCRETYCERYSGWQATVCNGCGSYVFCRYGRPIRYRRCPWYRRHYDCRRRRCVNRCNNCCGAR